MAIELKAAKRHIEGKKTQQLRNKGITPAHLFGPGVASESIQVDTLALRQTVAQAGHTGLITLHIGHEKGPRTVMLREVQTDNLKDLIVHVDFYQVNLLENIKVDVPIFLTGESAAAKTKGNALVQELNALTIECLPTAIPSRVSVDVSPIATPEQMVRVRDIQLPAEITILNDPGVVVARIAVEKVEVEVAKPTAEAEAAAAEGAEGAEGAEAAAGEKPAAGKGEKAEKTEKK